MASVALSQVPWDILVAAAVGVAGILFIVFSVGLTLGERHAQAILNEHCKVAQRHGGAEDGRPSGPDVPERGRGRGGTGGRRATETAIAQAASDDAAREAARAIEEAAAKAVQDLGAKAEAAARLLEQVEERIAQLKETVAALERQAEQGERREAAASTLGEATRAEAGGAEAGQEALGAARVPEKSALVLHLADQGLTLPEIARRAGIGRGEARLILDLHGKECQGNLLGTPTSAGTRSE